MFKTAISSLLVLLMIPTSGSACGFHNYTPQPTLVDRLLGSDEIVLARSTSNNPFRFEAFEALEGGLGSSEIPFLVDSATRRRFMLDANAAVLFARDGAYGPWQRLALVDTALDPVLRTVMTRLSDWEIGDDYDRFSYFVSLLEHPDDRIHKLALRELDLADYSLLRDLRPEIEPARLLARLNDPSELEFKPIRILLLGLSGSDHLLTRLEMGIESNVTTEGLHLGAYATAMIELVGPDAVTNIASSYLTNHDLSLFARELLIEAIVLHGQTGDPEMEITISESIESALWVDPGLAGAVARRFGSNYDWSFQNSLQALLSEGTVQSMADKQDVLQYLTFAREAERNPN